MSNKLKYIAENLDSLKIGLDETFKFNCTMCGKCCINREDILLKPKDLFVACKELSLKPQEFIQKYCECYVGDSSGLPIVRLKPVGENKRCPMLQGSRCAIHNAKPEVCAMFPIGRCISIDKNELENSDKISEIVYINQKVNCGDKRVTHTVREWLNKFNIPVDDEYFIEWHKVVSSMALDIQELEKYTPEKIKGLMYNNLFAFLYVDYDLEKDFMKQFKLNAEKATGMVKHIRKVAEQVKEELNGGKP
ncbi:MAG: YkgJ family cysteine cluster protein [Clostridia bacterium]|nr:YkgJ family cysteine cluster protein [Clostridia bacterium]